MCANNAHRAGVKGSCECVRGHPLAGSIKWAHHSSVGLASFLAIRSSLALCDVALIRTWVFIGFGVAFVA